MCSIDPYEVWGKLFCLFFCVFLGGRVDLLCRSLRLLLGGLIIFELRAAVRADARPPGADLEALFAVRALVENQLIMSDCRRFPSMTIRIPTAQEVTIARSLIL